MAAPSLPPPDRRASRARRSPLALAALAFGLLSGCDRLAAEVASRTSGRASAPAVPARAGQTRADVEVALARRLPLLVLTFAEPDTGEADGPYRVLRFTYEPAGPRRPRRSGSGLALWFERDYMPYWHLVWPGDHPPHSLYWTDVNRDGREDLLLRAGAGGVRSTHVYVDRGERSAFTDSAFALAYASANDYSALVDLDGDSTPEIVDSGHRGRARVPPPGCADLEISRRLHGPLAREYRRVAGEFDDANYKFGKSDDELATLEARAEYAFDALHLLHPAKIVTVHGAKAVDLTPEFPDHLRWRVGILTDLRKDLRTPGLRRCRNTVDAVVRHLKRSLARTRRGPWTPGG